MPVSGLGSRVSGLSAERHYKSFPQEIHTQTKMIRTKFLNGRCVMNISTTPQKYVACAMENQCYFLVVVGLTFQNPRLSRNEMSD